MTGREKAILALSALANLGLFALSYAINDEVNSHIEGALMFWVLPLILIGLPAVLLMRAETARTRLFCLACIFGLLFWSRVYFEISAMEPCFGGARPTVAFWMAPLYHPGP